MNGEAGTNGVLGWLVVAIGALVTLGVIVAAVRWTVHPGENEPNHPKRIILRDDR